MNQMTIGANQELLLLLGLEAALLLLLADAPADLVVEAPQLLLLGMQAPLALAALGVRLDLVSQRSTPHQLDAHASKSFKLRL